MVVFRFLGNLLLALLAIAILSTFGVVGMLYTFFVYFYKRKIGKSLETSAKRFKKIAVLIDKFGNVIADEFWNAILITKEATHKFGNWTETMSYVLALAQMRGHLTDAGKFLVWFLDFVDKGHMQKAIEQHHFNTI